MSNQVILADPFNKIWAFFCSVRLTIALLLSLAATSIFGTLIPQNEEPDAYFEVFGEFLYRIFDMFGLFDMYHSWWFQLLLVLLTANVIICSVDRLASNRSVLFVRDPSFNLTRFRNLKQKEHFRTERSAEQLKDSYQGFIARRFRSSRVDRTEHGFAVFGEKGRWTRFGVYGVHLSVIILLFGGLIGSIFGFDGFVNIPEGETVQQIRLRNRPQSMLLDFAIRCEDFKVSFYDTGAPREYRSSLTILEGAQPVKAKDIIVNDPLRYKGINIYQSSYGILPSTEVVLSVTSQKTGISYTQKASIHQPIIMPEKLGTFVLQEYRSSAEFKGRSIGETYVGVLTPFEGEPIEVLLPLRFPSFDKMRGGAEVIAVVERVPRYYTGLQVNKDPGVWVVYTGFVLMIIGCFITFFMSHQQVCIELVETGRDTEVILAGTANKNRTAMQARVVKMTARLAKMEHHV
jgi:cytochrome c biogenesis protein